MERVVGIEPTLPAWKAGVLPIYDTRTYLFLMERETGLEPATSTLARWHSTIESLTHKMVRFKGFEPLAHALEGRCSIQLS